MNFLLRQLLVTSKTLKHIHVSKPSCCWCYSIQTMKSICQLWSAVGHLHYTPLLPHTETSSRGCKFWHICCISGNWPRFEIIVYWQWSVLWKCSTGLSRRAYLPFQPQTHHMMYYWILLKGYFSDESHFSEINVKLAEKNKYATHSVQRS